MIFNKPQKQVIAAAQAIKILVLDVDGILTDGKLYFSNNGEEIKAFHALDGHGIKMLKSAGIEVGIISGRKSALLTRRSQDLGIELLYAGREDKLNAIGELMQATSLKPEQIAYAGDDFPDLPVLRLAGLAFAVPNAHGEIKKIACAQTENDGGLGAVREMCDFILQSQNLYNDFLQD